MKKKDILKLINAKTTITKNEKLLSTIQNRLFRTTHYEPMEFWFPKLPELKEYFDILKKELLDAKQETEEACDILSNTICQHEVRLNYHSLFCSSNVCVLCGQSASSDNVISFKESNYRNKHTITFPAKYQEDDDGPYKVKNGLTNEEVYTIIKSILENYSDDDEVDLVEEFSKLDIKAMNVNKEKRKNENYILIIGGTNRKYVNDTYISRKKYSDSTNFITYFSEVLNSKIAIIENRDILNNQEIANLERNHNNIFFQDYNSLDTFETCLYQVEKIPFKLIIDISELYDYQIQDESILSVPHELSLKDKFPNSHIVRIRSINSKVKEDEALEKLTDDYEILQTCEEKPKYYYLDHDKILKKETEEACNHIKMLLRK